MMVFNNEQELYAYLNDANNYKKARGKVYTCWVCKPPAKSVWKNSINNYEMMVTNNSFIVAGTRGEYDIISYNTLKSNFVFSDGSAITDEVIKSKIVNHCVDWFQVHSKPQEGAYVWACQIPKQYSIAIPTACGKLIANRKGIAHGKGDFVVCPDMNGKPNLNTRTLVNGVIFADTYNNQGWADLIEVKDGVVTTKPTKPVVDMNSDIPAVVRRKYQQAFYQALNGFEGVWGDIQKKYPEDVEDDTKRAEMREYWCTDAKTKLTNLAKLPMSYKLFSDLERYDEGKRNYMLGSLVAFVYTQWCSRNMPTIYRFRQEHNMRCHHFLDDVISATEQGSIAGAVANRYIGVVKDAANFSITLLLKTFDGKVLEKVAIDKKDIILFMQSMDDTDNIATYKQTNNPIDLLSCTNLVLHKNKVTESLFGLFSSLYGSYSVTTKEVYYTVCDVWKDFIKIIGSSGLTVKDSKFSTSVKDDTMSVCINGDDDDNLELICKTEINKTTWGVRVSGKSNNVTYNRYFPSKYFQSVKYRVFEHSKDVKYKLRADMFFALELFADICATLNVSPWRRFVRSENYSELSVVPGVNYTARTKETQDKFVLSGTQMLVVYKHSSTTVLKLLLRIVSPNGEEQTKTIQRNSIIDNKGHAAEARAEVYMSNESSAECIATLPIYFYSDYSELQELLRNVALQQIQKAMITDKDTFFKGLAISDIREINALNTQNILNYIVTDIVGVELEYAPITDKSAYIDKTAEQLNGMYCMRVTAKGDLVAHPEYCVWDFYFTQDNKVYIANKHSCTNLVDVTKKADITEEIKRLLSWVQGRKNIAKQVTLGKSTGKTDIDFITRTLFSFLTNWAVEEHSDLRANIVFWEFRVFAQYILHNVMASLSKVSCLPYLVSAKNGIAEYALSSECLRLTKTEYSAEKSAIVLHFDLLDTFRSFVGAEAGNIQEILVKLTVQNNVTLQDCVDIANITAISLEGSSLDAIVDAHKNLTCTMVTVVKLANGNKIKATHNFTPRMVFAAQTMNSILLNILSVLYSVSQQLSLTQLSAEIYSLPLCRKAHSRYNDYKTDIKNDFNTVKCLYAKLQDYLTQHNCIELIEYATISNIVSYIGYIRKHNACDTKKYYLDDLERILLSETRITEKTTLQIRDVLAKLIASYSPIVEKTLQSMERLDYAKTLDSSEYETGVKYVLDFLRDFFRKFGFKLSREEWEQLYIE